ncbi:MAG TPA: hypothetical protein PLB02_04870 [Thermoanaerobaculia bacterium]|nr:hypothetical protein [Thermoanaerobaculia bacterium]HQR66705.1 hypothetical protein [Thermoanaerobaculia bacterium]
MKRAALLLLLGAPLLLALFPALRRALLRKARLFLLLYAGALLLTGFGTGLWSRRLATLSAGELGLALAGVALVLAAFAAVARDALRDRATRG